MPDSPTEAPATDPVSAPDIGPGGLKTGGPFLLSQPEWLGIQRYLVSGMHLPADKAALIAQLGGTAPPNGIDSYADLIAGFAAVNAHCTAFNNGTLPDSVACADQIVQYNRDVPTYYGALTKLLPQLEVPTPDPTVVAQFKAIVTLLATQAQEYADHATKVKDGMKAFADLSVQDQISLGALHDKYSKLLGDQSPVIAQLATDAKTDTDSMRQWNSQYEHDTVVAATSATYAWLWPFGTIAAVVVAGVYGKRATDDLARVHEFQAKLDLVNNQTKAAAIMLLDLGLINSDLDDIGTKLAAALPTIEKIEGIWSAIASDLTSLATTIDTHIAQVPAIIRSLGIDTAIKDWNDVASEANAYRVNAFITVGTEAQAAAAPLPPVSTPPVSAPQPAAV